MYISKITVLVLDLHGGQYGPRLSTTDLWMLIYKFFFAYFYECGRSSSFPALYDFLYLMFNLFIKLDFVNKSLYIKIARTWLYLEEWFTPGAWIETPAFTFARAPDNSYRKPTTSSWLINLYTNHEANHLNEFRIFQPPV